MTNIIGQNIDTIADLNAAIKTADGEKSGSYEIDLASGAHIEIS